MWKPVRLQGVGAASSIIDANTHPAGKLDPWRAKVNCLFGLATQRHAQHRLVGNSLDRGWRVWLGNATATNPQVDRLPLEAWSDGMPPSTATWPSCCRSQP